jgi:hypothetical protein
MKKQNLLTPILLSLLFMLVIGACNRLDNLDDLKAVNYDAEFAIPLFTGTASFEDVLKNFDEETYITILPDGLIQLNYKGNVVARSSTDIFAGFPVLPFPVIDTVVGIGFNVPGSIDVDLAVLKNGTIEWFYQSEHGEPLIVEVTIENAIKDGQVFHNVRELSAASEVFLQTPIDITGYTLFPTNDSIFVRYQAYRPDVGYADTLTNFTMLFRDFEASYVEGYLGTDLYELPRDTIEIEFFENWTRGDVYFAEPTILIGVENSFGFPVRSKTNILSILTVEGDSVGLESSFIDDGIDFDYPSLDEVGEVKTTNFYFDNENSNIAEIIGAGPVSVDYDLDAIPNPDSDTSIRGFLTDSSYFKVQVEVNLPIYGTAIGFEARDTFSIDFSEYEKADYVEFKMIADNGIPVEVGLQAYFADSNGNILDSLFVPADVVLEAASVDGEGLVTARVEKTTFATFDDGRFQKIKAAKRIFLNASFSTTNDGIDEVKIFSDQNVEFRMGMKIGIRE